MSRFGVAGARLAAAGQRAAIERIAAFADECAIDCDFRRVSGFMFAETEARARRAGTRGRRRPAGSA